MLLFDSTRLSRSLYLSLSLSFLLCCNESAAPHGLYMGRQRRGSLAACRHRSILARFTRLRDDGGEVGEVQRLLCEMPGCRIAHEFEQLRRPWCGIECAGSRRSENVGSQHNSDLHLLRRRAAAVASRCVFTMCHIMVHGAEVPDVKRTRPLR